MTALLRQVEWETIPSMIHLEGIHTYTKYIMIKQYIEKTVNLQIKWTTHNITLVSCISQIEEEMAKTFNDDTHFPWIQLSPTSHLKEACYSLNKTKKSDLPRLIQQCTTTKKLNPGFNQHLSLNLTHK